MSARPGAQATPPPQAPSPAVPTPCTGILLKALMDPLTPRWFCHVDDDNYVNVRALLRLLASYPHTQDIYIGKPSLDRPIQATERVGENKMVSRVSTRTPAGGEEAEGVPATWGGAGGVSRRFPSHSVLSTSGLPPAGLASASAAGWP